MTTQEMLASVEACIRKDIPRLMELREGCWFINFNGNKHKSLGWCINRDNNRVHYSIYDGYMTYQTEKQMSKIETIGHDIMLNDVLEWLKTKVDDYYKDRICISLDGEISIPESYQNFGCLVPLNHTEITGEYNEEFTILKWNLFYSYLKDQSEELINFLYNLLK